MPLAEIQDSLQTLIEHCENPPVRFRLRQPIYAGQSTARDILWRTSVCADTGALTFTHKA